MRNALRALALALIISACNDGMSPARTTRPITVVFTDSAGRASLVRSGEAPMRLSQLDTTTLFATLSNGIVGLKRGQLSVFRLTDPVLHPLEQRSDVWGSLTPGAVSADGKRLAYAIGINSDVFLNILDLETGVRDSVNVATRLDVTAAPQIVYSTPIWSPSGDSVAFLLPNEVGIQVFLFERKSHRIEVKPLAIATSTVFHVLPGWPRWTSDGMIHFLVRRMEVDPYRLLDTLVVLRVDPRKELPYAEAVARAAAPDSLAMSDPWSYSFSRDGRSLAFAMTTTGGRAAIMVMREGAPTLETLLYQPGGPARVLLVP